MYAITLTRPGASAITHCDCNLINRHYEPPKGIAGQWVAIHSTQRYSQRVLNYLIRKGMNPPDDRICDRGIVAVAKVEEKPVTSGSSPWFEGPFGWVLEDVRIFRFPIPVSGQPGIWKVPQKVVEKLRKNLPYATPGFHEEDGVDCSTVALNVQTTGTSTKDRIIDLSAIEIHKGSIKYEVSFQVDVKDDEKTTMWEPCELIRWEMARIISSARYIVGYSMDFMLRYVARDFDLRPHVNPLTQVIDIFSGAKARGMPRPSYKALSQKYGTHVDGEDHLARTRAIKSYFMAGYLWNDIKSHGFLKDVLARSTVHSGGKIA